MTARYALYLAPGPETLLWRRACAWLGRDAATNSDVPSPVDRADEVVVDARRYGFHATIKAPFHLAPGTTAAQLCAEADSFGCALKPFDLPLRLSSLARFLALIPTGPLDAVAALHAATLAAFEPFRAPLDPADEARRLAAGLSDRQKAHLTQWGYPYVLEDFRLHFTLTGPLPLEEGEAVAALLAGYLGDAIAQPMRVDALCVFEQPGTGLPFRIIHRAPFSAA